MKKAIQLYEQAASKGYPVANYVLGKNYTGGTLGLKQDLGKSQAIPRTRIGSQF